MKLSTSMITTSDPSRNSLPPVVSFVLSATYSKNGRLYSTSVPRLTMHENARSEIGLRSPFIIPNPECSIFIITFFVSRRKSNHNPPYYQAFSRKTSLRGAQMYIPMTTCLVDYLFSHFDARIWYRAQMRACVFFQMYSFLHTFAP